MMGGSTFRRLRNSLLMDIAPSSTIVLNFRYMTPEQGYLTTDDGVRLFFQRVGNGPKTVVIPNGFHLLNDFEHLSDAYTFIFYDLRNRGWSDPISDASKLARGIHNDVDD